MWHGGTLFPPPPYIHMYEPVQPKLLRVIRVFAQIQILGSQVWFFGVYEDHHIFTNIEPTYKFFCGI